MKIHRPIEIMRELEFTYNGKTTCYKIRGVANHYGSYNGGHYNAFVECDGTWFCYDDEHVVKINDNFIDESRDAYLLCYEMI